MHPLSFSFSFILFILTFFLACQDIGGMEEELSEVRDNVVLPMQMWKLFKGELYWLYFRPLLVLFLVVLYEGLQY